MQSSYHAKCKYTILLGRAYKIADFNCSFEGEGDWPSSTTRSLLTYECSLCSTFVYNEGFKELDNRELVYF